MAGGLAILLAKGKSSKGGMPKDPEEADEKDDNPEEEMKEASLEDEFLDDAFEALKSEDKDAFREALKSAIKACYSAEKDAGEEY